VLALLIFVPAWSVTFWQGWVFWLIFSGSCILITLYFLERDPKLIESRMSAGPAAETETGQKIIQGVLGVVFVLLIALPGIDYRLGWSNVPVALVLVADILVAAGFLIVFLTFRANSFAASTITIREEQRVISSGPYAIVRHPMYSGALILLFGTPFALGSAWSALLVIPMLLGVVWRLLDEERFLAVNLPGYEAYREKTRYRLVPLIW
jgi:protein-S-isoprenylcysteine O-methyltransferase Ste14